MWHVLFLCFITRFGFGFHFLEFFYCNLCIQWIHHHWMILIQCMYFAPHLNNFFSFFSFLAKLIIFKKINNGHREPTPIGAPSTSCLLLLRGGWTSIELTFDFTLVTNYVNRWFILRRFLFSCTKPQSFCFNPWASPSSLWFFRTTR